LKCLTFSTKFSTVENISLKISFYKKANKSGLNLARQILAIVGLNSKMNPKAVSPVMVQKIWMKNSLV
jgi:hypothetical protein